MFFRTLEDETFMRDALELAKTASAFGEVPVGAIVVKDGCIIGRGYNQVEMLHSPLAHAEIIAIEDACHTINNWRLTGCSLYVTLEPCPMCAGAILNARIQRLIYGASDPKGGCCGSLINLYALDFNHHPTITTNILENDCLSLLEDFFQKLRM